MEHKQPRDRSQIHHLTNMLEDLQTFRETPPCYSNWKAALRAIDQAHADGVLSSEEQKNTLLAYLYEHLGPEVFDQAYYQLSDDARSRMLDALKKAEQTGLKPDGATALEFMDAILPYMQARNTKATHQTTRVTPPTEERVLEVVESRKLRFCLRRKE